MSHLVLRTLALVGWIAAAAWLVHLPLGATAGWLVFSAGVVLLLLHHVRHIALLARWYEQPAPGSVPRGRGLWDHLFAALYGYERRKTLEHRQLARTLARFREAGRAHPDGVVILDAENRIEWCNDTAGQFFDIELATDGGQPIVNLLRQPEFVAYLEAGDFSHPLELRLARKEATILSLQIVPYGEAQKLLLARDVTRLEKLEGMRRDFVANVSHELRTPLTVLSGFLETIRELDLDPQRTRDYYTLMAEQSKRMQSIVDDLLTLSTLESTPGPAFETRVPMAPLLARLQAEAAALSGGRHRLAFEAAGDCDLLGAEEEIASALGNLVSNAIRYTPDGGTIRLVWQASPTGAEFAVEDSGIGIAPEHIPRLTERFYRVDRGRSRATGGTGLGLAIVKHILGRHQAELDIRSTPGTGSRFTARFPARRVVAAVPAAVQRPA